MSTSNLYAQKVFSEHPVALWTLDENIGFLSLIAGAADSGKNLADADFWTAANCTVTDYDRSTFPYTKMDTYVSKIAVPGSTAATVTSVFQINTNDDEFSVCFYYFSENPFLTKIRVGFKDGASATVWSADITPEKFFQWNFATATFKKQTHTTEPNIILEFTGSGAVVLINGLSVGKYAESFARTSLGVSKELMQMSEYSSDEIGSTYGVLSKRYAGTNKHGYYVVDSNDVLLAKPSLPMVYGSSNAVTLLPSSTGNVPGLVVPGNRFFNNADKYKTRTFEAWMRIKSNTTQLRRIFGPIDSTDGLYVQRGYLSLKVGKYFASHFVGEWERPMLIHIVSSKNFVQLMVNGEVVVYLAIDISTIDFPYNMDANGNDEDWLGFYAYTDVPRVEVDCVAIYNYSVGKELAILRYGFAQSTNYPENIIAAHNGQSIVPDYAFSRYPNNQNYGNNQPNSWRLGRFKNTELSYESLTTPNVNFITSVVLDPSLGITQEQYFADLSDAVGSSDPYISLRPDSSYSSSNSHIESSLRIFRESVEAFYVVAKRTEANTAKQTIFRIVDSESGDYYEAYIKTTTGTTAVYHSFFSDDTETVLEADLTRTADYNVGSMFAAGIFVESFRSGDSGDALSTFFNKPYLSLYIGGSGSGTQTFTGKIYKIAFDTEENTTYSLPALNSDDSPFYYGDATNALTHIPTHGIVATKIVDFMQLSVESKGYWTDNLPLSSLATYVPGSTNYTLDYVQINLDYPKPQSIVSGAYDTSDSEVTLYVSFQNILEDPSIMPNDLTVVNTPQNGVIVPGATWDEEVYNVVDGTILYMPPVADLTTLKMVLHIDISTNNGTQFSSPISVRTLQIAGQTLRRDGQPQTFGAKHGVDLEYYGEDADGTSAVIMQKTSEPYYYLSSKSGIKPVGVFDLENEHGYRLKINKDAAEEFNINSLHMTVKYSEQSFPDTEQALFRINAFKVEENVSIPEQYSFYVMKNTDTSDARGKIIVKYSEDGGTETEFTNIRYYQNGSEVNDVILSLDEWDSVSFTFTKVIRVDNEVGSIDFCGPITVASFSYTQTSGDYESTPISVSNRWVDTLYTDVGYDTWATYDSGTTTWAGVAAVAEVTTGEVVGFDSEELHQTYFGTGRIIGDNDPNNQIITESHKYKVYTARYSTNSLITVV